MSEPLVSIIIPVYNAGPYLAATIRSAIKQTWTAKEIIIVDDGSTDDSLNIAETFASAAVKIFSQANKGASAARNRGLSEANGTYIQFLDADDLLSADKIASQAASLQANPGKVAVCSTVHFTDDQDPLSCTPSAYEDAFLLDTVDPVYFLINLWGGYAENGAMVQPNAWLTPRVLIDKAGAWNESLSVDDDGEFFCRVLLASRGVVKTGGCNYYRKHPAAAGNLSAGKKLASYRSLFASLTLRFNHVGKISPTRELQSAYLKSLYALGNSIYPSFPSFRKEIKQAINDLGGNAYLDMPIRLKIKKILKIRRPPFWPFQQKNKSW